MIGGNDKLCSSFVHKLEITLNCACGVYIIDGDECVCKPCPKCQKMRPDCYVSRCNYQNDSLRLRGQCHLELVCSSEPKPIYIAYNGAKPVEVFDHKQVFIDLDSSNENSNSDAPNQQISDQDNEFENEIKMLKSTCEILGELVSMRLVSNFQLY